MKITWEWLVGFYEGEGSTWLDRKTPYVCIYQKEKQVLIEIKKFLKCGKLVKKTRPKETCRIMWSYLIGGKDAANLLLRMIPRMRTKKREKQARKVLGVYGTKVPN